MPYLDRLGEPSAPDDWSALERIFGAPNPMTADAGVRLSDIGQNLGAFATGGIHGVLQNQGVQMPQWMNSAAGVLQNPDANAAMGMMGPGRIPRASAPVFAAETGGAAKPAMATADYVAELKRAAGDNAAFDSLISALKADKSITQPQMREIAQQFIGWEFAPSRPRSQALQHIIDRQMVDARQNARMQNIDKTNNSW